MIINSTIFKTIRDGFKWHFFPRPKEIQILSIFEILFYVAALFVCGWLYFVIQEVPVHRDSIECSILEEKSDSSLWTACVRYDIPMSYVLEDGSKSFGVKISTSFEKDTVLHRHPYCRNSKRDSLLAIYRRTFPQSNSSSSVIYSKVEQSNNNLHKNTTKRKTSEPEIEKDSIRYVTFIKTVGKSKVRWDVLEGPMPEWNVHKVYGSNYYAKNKATYHGIMSRPSKVRSPYDISQCYYKLNFTGNFDKEVIIFDFIGATHFSEMWPEPDKKTMSSIEFSDPEKIKEIEMNGLTFHAQFPELQNWQSARVFLLTALMSAILAILITFLILSLYKVGLRRWDKEKPLKPADESNKESI